MSTSTPPSDPYGAPGPEQQGHAPTSGQERQGPGGLAVAALVVGIVAFFIGLLPFVGLLVGAAAIVLGIVVLRRSRDGSVGAGTRKAFGLVGVIGGGLAVLASVVTTALFLVGAASGSISLS